MSAVDYSLQIDEARETAICEVRGLSKSYRNFWLNDVSFKLEPGYIMGFVGRNGAGKSTTIKSMLRLVKPDCGEVKMFGMDYAENEEECKKHLGIVLGEFDYYADKKLKTVTGVVRRFYPEWDEAAYRRCISRFELDETKRVKELSAGMKVKYALALALSHNARLLILDEPTDWTPFREMNCLMFSVNLSRTAKGAFCFQRTLHRILINVPTTSCILKMAVY